MEARQPAFRTFASSAIALVGGTAAGWTLPTDFLVHSSMVLMRAPSRPNCSQRASGSQPGLVQATRSSLTATPDSSSPRLACRIPLLHPLASQSTTCTWPNRALQSSPRILFYDLSSSNYTYLIVDARMAYDVPELGVYFTPSDPTSVQPQGTKSPFYGRLNKFNTVQWAVKVFQSDNYSIYRFYSPATQLVTSTNRQSRGESGEGIAGEADGDPVTGTRRVPPRVKSLWLSTWPLWTLLVFASLAAVRLLPWGYARAAVAAPILLIIPGSLTLGAVFNQRHRPRGLIFVCYAALLSAIWSAFASLTLYVDGGSSRPKARTGACLPSRLYWP